MRCFQKLKKLAKLKNHVSNQLRSQKPLQLLIIRLLLDVQSIGICLLKLNRNALQPPCVNASGIRSFRFLRLIKIITLGHILIHALDQVRKLILHNTLDIQIHLLLKLLLEILHIVNSMLENIEFLDICENI